MAAELLGLRAKGGEGVFSVLPQFGISVPRGNVKSEVENDFVVFAIRK